MPPLKTRPCTEVYSEAPAPDHVPQFLEREIVKVESFEQQRVKGRPHMTKDQTRTLIKELIEASVHSSKRSRRLRDLKPNERQRRPKLSREAKVNQKRRLIAECIRNQQTLNLKQVAKHTKSCYKTVKKVYWSLVDQRQPETYEYNNVKDPTDLAALEADIRQADGGLASVADLKRANPTFSRKKILEVLHSLDLRWRKLPLAEPKFRTYDPPSQTRLDYIISTMAQVHANPDAQMLYVDEMKYPLIQTAKYHWIGKDRESQIKLNRRDVQDTTLTAIALCSTERFVAVQLFRGEINGQDFLNFLNTAISRLSTDKHYLILADNATWHSSALVQKSEAYRYLFFNEPRMFQINMIENAFSAVRAEFRKRDMALNVEEEARIILDIFYSKHNTDRFEGYNRNHLRMLQKYIA